MTIQEISGTSAAVERPVHRSALCRYALEGLNNCWMAERGRYSHRYRFDVSGANNEMRPASDAFYTLNVLLGLSQLGELPAYLDPAATFADCCTEAGNPAFTPYAHGMALWAGASVGLTPAPLVIDRIRRNWSEPSGLSQLSAQDVGMLACGAVAHAGHEKVPWRPLADLYAMHIRGLYDSRSQLFNNNARGLRRHFASFASQVYPILALYRYGEAFAVDWAIELAGTAAARLIRSQGSQGEWPWFFFVPRGQIVDFYEIYSVHQIGMAPAFLHHAVAHGVTGARDALINGARWYFGGNALGVSMLRTQERMHYRSQVRAGELNSSLPRMGRAIRNALTGHGDTVATHRGLVLRPECRSYELGWMLWSFADRRDYPDITEHPAFSA